MKVGRLVFSAVLLVAVAGALWLGLSTFFQSDQRVQVANGANMREFSLVAKETLWQLSPVYQITAWAYEGQIPGPELRVKEGDKVRVNFKNELTVPTSIHWHGVDVPNSMDGVPGVTQQAVQPGDTFIYEFIAKPSGTHFYHAHGSGQGDEARQMDMGLSGPFIIEPLTANPTYAREYTLMLDDWNALMPANDGESSSTAHEAHGNPPQQAQEPMASGEMMEGYNLFSINGKAFSASEPLIVEEGERVRIRLINVSTMSFHPMHLHGHQFKIVATDGNPVPESVQLTKNVINIAPGESFDIEFTADNPGTWLFHCHELHHADGGMAVLVEYAKE